MCAFHQSYKISAEVFDVWCDLLERIPGSVLWLLQWNVNVQATLTAAGQARGIAVERLAFAPLLPLQGHMTGSPASMSSSTLGRATATPRSARRSGSAFR